MIKVEGKSCTGDAVSPVAGFCIAGPGIEVMTLFSTELRPNLVLKIVRPTCIFSLALYLVKSSLVNTLLLE